MYARAEGVAAIDPEDGMTDSRFPRGGTVGHAALLVVGQLLRAERPVVEHCEFVAALEALAVEHRRYWSNLADRPDHLAAAVLELLQDHRLAEVSDRTVRLLPVALFELEERLV